MTRVVSRERDRVNAVIAEARDDTKAHSEAGAKGGGMLERVEVSVLIRPGRRRPLRASTRRPRRIRFLLRKTTSRRRSGSRGVKEHPQQWQHQCQRRLQQKRQ